VGHRISKGEGKADDGVFAGWSWDGAVLRAYNDRYGFRPLYYFRRGEEIALSTSILRLLAEGAPAEPNYSGLAVYLRLGCFLAEETPFREIHALPPNVSFEWKNGTLSVAGGLRPAKPQQLSRSAAVDAYIQLFREAIRRREPPAEDFAVPLSGGRDSRHILFALCEAGYRPKFCVTARYFPPGDMAAEEIEIASAVTSAVKVGHVVVDQPSSRCGAEARNNIETEFCAGDALWMLAVADFLKGKVRYMYDGIGGDVLSAGLFLTRDGLELFEAGRLEELAQQVLGAEPRGGMYRASAGRQLDREVAVGRVAQELRRHADAPNAIGSFYFWNRTRRQIAMSPYRILVQAGEVFSPYLDHEVFDLLSGLRAEMFLDHTFHTEAIQRAYPQYAAVAFAAKREQRILSSDRAPLRGFARDVLSRSLRHGRPALVRRSYFMPRLVRCLVDPSYSRTIDWLGRHVLYALQLEEVIRGGRRREPARVSPCIPLLRPAL
jgi:asparagine synthetase B (glutamine-hydrolysing)